MFTGTVTNVEMKSREPFDGQSRYSPNSSRSEVYLSITISANGVLYYFNTPAAVKTVAVAPGVAVVCYRVENGAAQWMQEVGDSGVATSAQRNANGLHPLVNVGDVVSVNGRLTMKTSRSGKSYGVMTHIKRLYE